MLPPLLQGLVNAKSPVGAASSTGKAFLLLDANLFQEPALERCIAVNKQYESKKKIKIILFSTHDHIFSGTIAILSTAKKGWH